MNIHLFGRNYISPFPTSYASNSLYLGDTANNLGYNPDKPDTVVFNGSINIFGDLDNENYEKFWKTVFISDSTSVIADKKNLIKVFIQFYKSIFRYSSIDTIYTLYNLNCIKRLHSMYYMHHFNEMPKFPEFNVDNDISVSKEEFEKVYKSTPVSEFIKLHCSRNNLDLSTEFYIPDVLLEVASEERSGILKAKVTRLLKKRIDEMVSISQSLADASYCFFEKENISDYSDHKQFFSNLPRLSDSFKLFENNYKGLYDNLGPVVIKEHLDKLNESLNNNGLIGPQLKLANEIIYILENDIDDFLKEDIKRLDNSLITYAGDEMKYNRFIIGYFYKLKQLGNIDLLNKYRLN